MTAEQREVHLTLLASLPSRVHRWEPAGWKNQGRPTAEHTRRLNKVIRELARSMSRKEIAQKLGIETQTVARHLRGDRKCLRDGSE